MSYYGHQQQLQQPMGLATQPQPTAATTAVATANASGQKHDIFVGNLAFTTTEEQLYSAFSELGRIIKVRMVSDIETGKPRGFAFIEFEDPQAALSGNVLYVAFILLLFFVRYCDCAHIMCTK